MRNWNFGNFLKSTNSGSPRWEPTYEELKLSTYSLPSLFAIQLRAYLWGIETMKFIKLTRALLGWEPTYEELKLFVVLISCWKRIWLRAYLWGIETWRRNTKKKRNGVESLPMRNWNFSAVSINSQENIVESLPMRNWNFIRSIIFLVWVNSWEPTYEELKHSSINSFSDPIFRWEPTYEELKLSKEVVYSTA